MNAIGRLSGYDLAVAIAAAGILAFLAWITPLTEFRRGPERPPPGRMISPYLPWTGVSQSR